jgi:histidyl-tRNA synthetase
VFRNEKPGPGRFRQFMQFDADTVGSASPAADAEVCMMAADTMEALGIKRGQYVLKINSRKMLIGFRETHDIPLEAELSWLRALDKRDRLGDQGVAQLLGRGRKDESGDFTPGAGLNEKQIEASLSFAASKTLQPRFVAGSKTGEEGFSDIDVMLKLCQSSGYGVDRICYDSSVVRGLEYYTGPVFECELLMETKDEDGRPVRFGSVGGGGRYDDLVARFTGQKVPATGFSLGVSRLYAALRLIGKAEETSVQAPVVVLVLDKDRQGDYWRMVMRLREAGIRSEMYVGTAGMKAQMKYADKRGAPLAIIQGTDEKARGEVQIKDLALGAKLAAGIGSRQEYTEQRLAQFSVKESELVEAVRKALR